VAHRREGGRRRRPDLGERGIAAFQFRVLVSQRRELADELVELGVGDLGLVVAVVALAVVPDLVGKLAGARGDGGRDRSGCAGHPPQSTDRV
jgi:hypothetical protein